MRTGDVAARGLDYVLGGVLQGDGGDVLGSGCGVRVRVRTFGVRE